MLTCCVFAYQMLAGQCYSGLSSNMERLIECENAERCLDDIAYTYDEVAVNNL